MRMLKNEVKAQVGEGLDPRGFALRFQRRADAPLCPRFQPRYAGGIDPGGALVLCGA